MSTLNSLEPFDCDGQVCSVAVRWQKWKRALEVYLEAANIDSPAKKRANLLHIGGLGLQEIYYNLPGAHISEQTEDVENPVNVYEIAIRKLDEYFAPKQSKVYERHVFRLIKQEMDEKFEKFLVRLRNQAEKCVFSNTEENIIDQIVEKCSSSDLRKKILTIGDSISLENILAEANALEAVSRQMEEFAEKKTGIEVNQINNNTKQKFRASEIKSCFRCGSKGHISFNCPAREKICKKCGYKGHVSKQCRTKPGKRRTHYESTTVKKSRYREPDKDDDDHNTNYVFHIDNDCDILCMIGGIPVQMVIDSGSKCNILNDETWTYLKNSQVSVSNQIK
ncbi:unnamed protein product [Acanthoscelides obtectus]|uniref:CCHC-type domain-containing protein n=1 Tax=Acanthoscelides obtectus TaxID=200917 RepID=A0A9P0KEE7_ACAOB|nr:unnamed protein product [Acanthoscelides obtectus]CAK1668774.1 Gag polyprotein [Acanthoscelides obtectus]